MSEAAPEAIIALDKVYREYPAHGESGPVKALRNISFTVPKGARVAIRGDSGSGKSTLLNLLGGLDLPTRGTLRVAGRELNDLSERALTRYRAESVGFVFQSYNLLPTLSALENVELPMEAVGALSREARQARAEELLAAVGMAERKDGRPGRLSGGEQQRVAVARALANNPAIILADEPTGNLDKKSRGAVMRLLEKVNVQFGTTLVVVTHDPNVAAHCETIYQLKRGKLVGIEAGVRRSAWQTVDEAEDEAETEEEGDEDEADDEVPAAPPKRPKGPAAAMARLAPATPPPQDDDE